MSLSLFHLGSSLICVLCSSVPKPGRKRRRPQPARFDGDERPTQKMYDDLEREMIRMAEEAIANTGELCCVPCDVDILHSFFFFQVTFDHFDFEKNCKVKTKNVPTDVLDWNDEIPRVAESKDGVRIAVYLPNAVRKKAKVGYTFSHFWEWSEQFCVRIKSMSTLLASPNTSHP